MQGTLASGLTGNPTSDHACTQAWRAPNAGALALTGAGAASGSTITATLQVEASGNPVEDFGTLPSETEFVYSIGGRTVGPVNQTKVTVPDLPAGQQFTPSVEVYPAGHPGAAVTVTGSPFSQTLPWPSDLRSGTRVIPAVGSDPNSGSLTVVFPPDLPSGGLTAGGVALNCGSTSIPEPDSPVSGGRVGYAVDLVNSGGACAVSLTLTDSASPDPYGGPSPEVTVPFQIGAQPSYSFTASVTRSCALNFVCGLGGQPYQVEVSSTGPGPLSAGGDWAVASRGGPLDSCSTNQGLPGPSFPYTFDLPSSCPSSNGVDITVSYRYLGQDVTVDAGSPGGGGAPATTTPAPSTTTTSTTLPTVTTVPGCPTTTTTTTATTATTAPASTAATGAATVNAAATTSTAAPTTAAPTTAAPTTAPASTSTSVACTSSAVRGAGPAGTALAATAAPSAAHVDPTARSAIAWLLGLAGLAWLLTVARGLRRPATAGRHRRRRPTSEKGRP